MSEYFLKKKKKRQVQSKKAQGCKVSRRKEMTKIRAQIHDIEPENKAKQINETKS